MESEKYFWNNLNIFANNNAFVDTLINKSFTYAELERESQVLVEKLKLPSKNIIILFTTNNPVSIIAYNAALKSGNAVILLDEKLNNEVRNSLVENYKPDFIISSIQFLLSSTHFRLNTKIRVYTSIN